jgi:hypothetical protein
MNYDKFDYYKMDYVEDEYTKTHVLYHSKHWHIFWNNFTKPYRAYSIKFHNYYKFTKELVFCICYGIGEFSISYTI